MGLLGGALGKYLPANAGDTRDSGSILSWELENEMTTIPVFLPGEFNGQRSLVGYSPWGFKESDKTEHPHTTTISYSIINLGSILLTSKKRSQESCKIKGFYEQKKVGRKFVPKNWLFKAISSSFGIRRGSITNCH